MVFSNLNKLGLAFGKLNKLSSETEKPTPRCRKLKYGGNGYQDFSRFFRDECMHGSLMLFKEPGGRIFQVAPFWPHGQEALGGGSASQIKTKRMQKLNTYLTKNLNKHFLEMFTYLHLKQL